MKCPQCGNDVTDGARFCAHCGTPLDFGASQTNGMNAYPTQPNYPDPYDAPSNGPAGGNQINYANQAPQPVGPGFESTKKKRSKAPLVAILVILFAGILVFAGFGLGIIPRFWKDDTPNKTDEKYEEYIDEENGTELPDLAGLSQSEAESRLVDAGFTKGKVIEKYSFAADPDTSDLVARTQPSAGTKLAEGSPVDLVFVYSPDVRSTQELIQENLKIGRLIDDNPDWLIGNWKAETELKEMGDWSRDSNCDAASDAAHDFMPKITISNASYTQQYADATLSALIHEHDNSGNARHYHASDDSYQDDVADFFSKGDSMVLTLSDDDDYLAWGNETTLVENEGTDDEKEVPLRMAVRLSAATDVDLNDPADMASAMGDDFATEYESEQDAQDALWKAILADAYPVLGYGQSHGGSDQRTEIFKLKRIDE